MAQTMTGTKTLDEIVGDQFDIRDMIERFEELESEREACETDHDDNPDPKRVAEFDASDDGIEYATIKAFLADVEGCGGDEQWRGSWYPVGFIAESYFVEAMQELVTDIGDLPRGIPSYLEIDWKRTADNLRADYSSVDLEGTTYWYR